MIVHYVDENMHISEYPYTTYRASCRGCEWEAPLRERQWMSQADLSEHMKKEHYELTRW